MGLCDCCGPKTKDFFKLFFPVVWGVISFAAIFAYAAYGRWGPTGFSFLSALISFILAYDIFFFHRHNSYGTLKQEQKRKSQVFLKFMFALFLGLISIVILIVSQSLRVQFQYFGSDDAVWTGIGLILSIIWAVDIGKYHMWTNESLTEPDTVASETDSRRESNMSEFTNS